MKFFKHFTDAHEGKSMMALMDKFGLEGYAAFFILTEICAKKLEKRQNEEVSDDHFMFTFNERIIREKLRMRSTKVELFLNYCVTLDLLQFHKNSQEFNFYFPKLLESLDRDSKRARARRGHGAPKKKNKELELEKKVVKKSLESSEPISGKPSIATNSVVRFEERFTLADFDQDAQWVETLSQVGLAKELKRYVPKLRQRFSEISEFSDWLNALTSDSGKFSEIENRGGQIRYIVASVLREIGERL